MHNQSNQYANNYRILEVYKEFVKLIVLHPIASISVYFLFSIDAIDSVIPRGQPHYIWSVVALFMLFHAWLAVRFHNAEKDPTDISSWETYCSILMCFFGLGYAVVLGYLAYASGPTSFMLLTLILTTIISLVAFIMVASPKVTLSFVTPIMLSVCSVFVVSQTTQGYGYASFLATYYILIIVRSKRLSENNFERLQVRENSTYLQTKLTVIEAKLKGLVTTDKESGLYTRDFWENSYAIEFRRAKRSSSPLSIIHIEIDCFAEYEKSFGSNKGHKLYVKVASIIRSKTQRAGEIAAVYNNKAFVLLLPNVIAEDAGKFGNIIQRAVLDANIPHNVSKIPGLSSVSVSTGIAEFTRDIPVSRDDLLTKSQESLQPAHLTGATYDDSPSHHFTFGGKQ